METFAAWLESELQNRGWRLSDLSRKANLDTGSVSRILSGTRNPGPEICLAIAQALNYPPEIVFRHAGLLPPEPETSSVEKEAGHLFRQLGELEQRRILQIMRAWLEEK
jgi:transcriptional regulator with XRE-family HTH domain